MYRTQIPIEELEPLHGHIFHNPDLVDRIKRLGWEGIPPIPVIEIPESLRVNDKKYSFCDGHRRYDAGIRTGTPSINCLIYGKNDDREDVSAQSGESYIMTHEAHLSSLKNHSRR